MAIKTRSEENKFELYRDKKSVTNTMLFLALATIFCGMFFSYWGYGNEKEFYFLIIGIVFIALGTLSLFLNMQQHKVVKDNEGFIHLLATEEGLSLAPNMGMSLEYYPWDKISKIILAKTFISDEGINGKSYSPDVALIYLQNLEPLHTEDRSKYQIAESPKEFNVISLELPKGALLTIKQKLDYFSKGVTVIDIYRTVEFSYTKNDENYANKRKL
jgi:hypothetical protein